LEIAYNDYDEGVLNLAEATYLADPELPCTGLKPLPCGWERTKGEGEQKEVWNTTSTEHSKHGLGQMRGS
jgi:hypothetical protein